MNNKHYKIYLTKGKTAFNIKRTYLYIVDDYGNVVYYAWFGPRYSYNYSLMVKLVSDVIEDSSFDGSNQFMLSSIIISYNYDTLVFEGIAVGKYEEHIVYSTDFYTIG